MQFSSQVGVKIRHDGNEVWDGVMTHCLVIPTVGDLNIICFIISSYSIHT